MLKNILFVSFLCTLASVAQGSYPGYIHTQLLEIVYPQVPVEDFSYSPTPEGYRFSYRLADGRQHEEMAYIVDPNSPEAAAYQASEAARRSMPRPSGTKNRKLSPKALGSLAG